MSVMSIIPWVREQVSPAAIGTPARRREPDWILIAVVATLLLFGLMTTYTTTVFTLQSGRNDIPIGAFQSQLKAAMLGVVGFILFAMLDYGVLRPLALPAGVAIIVMLGVVALGGSSIDGYQRSIVQGSITPSEFAKPVVIVYAATWLASRRNQMRSIMVGLVPYALFVGAIVAFLVMQPDFSTALVIVATAAVMFWLAGASWRQVAISLIVGAIAFYLVVAVRDGHTGDRWRAYLDGLRSYETMHAHMQRVTEALANGGLFGRGFGFGEAKYRVPAIDTDSVVAAIGEELGWVGLLGVVGLFGLLTARCIQLIKKADTLFGQILVVGIATWLFMQMGLNLLGNLSVLPLPGVPVPFLSRGGSSMLAVMCACGILVSVSRGSVLSITADSHPEEDHEDARSTGPRAGVRRRNSRARAARPERVDVFESDAPVVVGRCVRNQLRTGKFASEQRTGVARIVRGKR